MNGLMIMINQDIVNGILSIYKGNFIEFKTLGKRNKVFNFRNSDGTFICKVYDNKYFPKQAIHEKNILKEISDQIRTPKIIDEGIYQEKRYMIMSNIDGKLLEEDICQSYEVLVSNYLKKLHQLTVKIPLVEVNQDHQETFLKVLNNSSKKIIELYEKQNFRSKTSFIHYNPHFRHFLKNDDGLYLVDWEDATIDDEMIDHASFIKDMLESKRPLIELSNYVNNNELEDLINPYLGKLYMIDNHYNHCPIKSNNYTAKIFSFFLNNNFYESMEDINIK